MAVAHRYFDMDAYGWEGQHEVGDYQRAARDGHNRAVHCERPKASKEKGR